MVQGKKLLDTVRDKIRIRHYSIKTERSYVDWIKRYFFFMKMPSERDGQEWPLVCFLAEQGQNMYLVFSDLINDGVAFEDQVSGVVVFGIQAFPAAKRHGFKRCDICSQLVKKIHRLIFAVLFCDIGENIPKVLQCFGFDDDFIGHL